MSDGESAQRLSSIACEAGIVIGARGDARRNRHPPRSTQRRCLKSRTLAEERNGPDRRYRRIYIHIIYMHLYLLMTLRHIAQNSLIIFIFIELTKYSKRRRIFEKCPTGF